MEKIYSSTRNFLTFVNTTAIAYHRNPEALVDFLPIWNSGCVHKRQKITSTFQSGHYFRILISALVTHTGSYFLTLTLSPVPHLDPSPPSSLDIFCKPDNGLVMTAPQTRARSKVGPETGGSEPARPSPGCPENGDSDFSIAENRPLGKGGNISEQKVEVGGYAVRKADIPNGERISRRLKDVIMKERKGLQKMYGKTEAELDESLRAPIKRGEEMARKLVNEMGCNSMVAKDLTVLTLYDVAILIGMF